MKEISEIIKAYYEATALGLKTALATVVHVEGSYRQPGARMLVTETGDLTGAISGGCLEGDALRKALLAINQRQNKLITYDTSNDDDVEFGVQLGCNGIVHILFEYIDQHLPNNPIALLKQLAVRQEAVVVTLFAFDRKLAQVGTVFFYRNGFSASSIENHAILGAEAAIALHNKTASVKNITADEMICQALFAYIPPPVSLVIAGAGNDVKPVVEVAGILGWEITVADGRATHATPKRFPSAKQVMVAKPQELVGAVPIDDTTFFVLMTHNYKYDLALLQLLLETDCRYIGILGPKMKLHRMLDDLNGEGIVVSEEQLSRIYGPVGLEIGAETSEEIALSIIAEIEAVLSGAKGTSLKYKEDKIHLATPMV